jgi:predicted MFS family arabinose efflux permease
MVSAVRVAMTVPMMLMAIPAGLVADAVDRRKLMIVTQLFLLISASILATLTYTAKITSWSLLLLTFVTGIAMVMHILTWQATIPELIPRPQLSRAVALGSISFNLARSVGPALGGFLIAMAGVWIAFAFNACSFAVVLIVLIRWQSEPNATTAGQSVVRSVSEGWTFVWSSKSMRHTLIRLGLFMVPAAALWSLLPLVARHRLMWDERGFGFLVTAIGVGAVIAVWFLHGIHRRFGFNRTILCAGLLFSASLGSIGLTVNGVVVSLLTLAVGGSWMVTLTTLNSEVQMTLPTELRGRGMSFYYAVMAASMATGSLLWGQVAGSMGIGPAIVVASATLVVTGLVGTWYPLDERSSFQ